ncbi:MAG: PAS domain S-box protein, partial [Acidobacteriota bacterium]|nr:PAS domain S-box protein [Acidobacteriota bacterium]
MIPLLAAPKPEQVTIQLKWRHQFQFAGYYAAQRMGYFAAEGIEAHLVEGGPRRDAVREVMTGNAAYGIGDSGLLLSRAQGLPVVVVAAIFQHSPYVLVTRAADGIKGPKDLVGKRVMVEFGEGEIQTKAMLAREGIDLSSVTFLRYSWNLLDLAEGRTDAMAAYSGVEPYQLEQMGTRVNVIRPEEHGIDFYGDCLFTTATEARNHPARVEAVRRAVIKGWTYALEHTEEVIGWILAMPGVQERGIRHGNLAAESEAMKPLILSDIVPLGHMNEERWQRTLAVYKEGGILPSTMGLDGFIFESSPWLSARNRDRLLLAGGIIAGVWFLVLAWNLTLRRRVRQGLAALRESEDRFKQLVETAPEAIFIEHEAKFDYLNPAAVELFGLHSAEEMIGHSVLENVHEDDKPRIQGRVQGFLEHPAPLHRTELRLHRPDGRVVEVEAMTSPIAWKGGTAARVFLRDITERNIAWQAMAESEENYRQLVENAQDCIFVANGGVFCYVNPAGMKIFEVEAEQEILGKPMADFIHPNDRSMMAARELEFRDTGVPMPTQEVRVVGHRGGVTPVEVTMTRVYFQGEVATRVFMRDITAWKQAESALKNSQGILRGFFDGAPFQMGVTEFTEDEDVVLISVNAAAAASMGMDVKEAPGVHLSSLGLPGPHHGIWVEQYHQAQNTGEPVHFERQVFTAGGEQYWAVTLACTGKSPNGRPRFAYLVEDVTERKQMARALDEREATLRAFYDGAPMLMGVTEVTPDGEMIGVSVNEAMARSFGKKASEIVGLTAAQIGMGPEDRAVWLGRYREAEAVGQPIHFVLGGQGRDHKDWLSVTIAPLEKSEAGNPRFCFISENITEFIRDQEALRASESRLEEAQRLGHLGSWNWDLATKTLSWSDELCRIYGVEPCTHRPSNEDFLSRLHPEDQEQYRDQVAKAMSDLKPYSHTIRILRPDGEVRTLFNQVEVLVDGQGQPTGMAGACMDITEQTRAEQALRQSELEQRRLAERLTAAQAIGHVGSWETDLSTMESIWSEQTHQIYGTDPRTFKPNHVSVLRMTHPDDRAGLELAFQEALHQDVPHTFVHRIITPGGITKVLEARWHVFQDEQGKPLRAVGTCQDITERNQAERTQETLYRISEAAQSAETLPDLFKKIHEIIGGLLPAKNFFVALYDERKDELTFPYFVDEQDPTPGTRKLNDGTLTGQVIRTGKALLLTREAGEGGS